MPGSDTGVTTPDARHSYGGDMVDEPPVSPPVRDPRERIPFASARENPQDTVRPGDPVAADGEGRSGSTRLTGPATPSEPVEPVPPGVPAPAPGPSALTPVRTLATDLRVLGDRLAEFARRPWPGAGVFDVGLVLSLAMSAIPLMVQSQRAAYEPFWGVVAAVCVVLFSAPFFWRRTYPMTVALVVALPHVAQLFLLDEPTFANISAPIAVYSVARWSADRHVRRAGLLLGVVGSTIAGLSWSPATFADGVPLSVWVGSFVVITMMCLAMTVTAWLLGALVRQRAEAIEETRQRALAVERGRVQNIRIAAQEERARIAREMHDVVAHSLSVIVVQSDGAAYALDSAIRRANDEDDVRVVADALRNASTVLETIGRTARESLADTRRLVAVLRQDEGDAEYAPTGGVDSLGDLIEPLRAAGLQITTDVTGRPRPLSRATDLAVYRVVQEALTNVIKHAGEARVWVSLDYLPEALLVTVRDDGAGVVTPPDGQGHGLVGMRERLAASGGRLWAGGAPGGGFVVEARIPYDEGHPSGA